jgi:histone deacetylase HOS2
MLRSSIVQEYGEPSAIDGGASGINHEELLRLIDRAAAENGIERPKGYTVSWHHNPDVEAPHFGKEHPMKPFRLRLTKNLIFCYGMHKAMDCPPSRPATVEEMKAFHTEDYLKFLERLVRY